MDTRTFTPTGDLPEALTERPQWICWKYQANGSDKPRKVPCTPKGGSLNEWQKNPAQWLSHDDAVAAYQANNNLAGIGFVLTSDTGITGVDMDSAIDTETGEVAEWAQAHLADFDTYTEVSPSRTGLRMFTLGSLPDGCPKKSGHREIYDAGRWLTVTGKTISDEPVNACPGSVSRYLAAMQPDGEKAAQSAAHEARQGDIIEGDRNTRLTSLAGYLRRGDISESEILATLREANSTRCKPPLSDNEVAGIAHSVCRYEPDMDATQPPATITASLRMVEVGDLSAATLPPVECVMHPYMPRRQVTLFGGHGGTGKTYLGLVFAAHIATGEAWAGHECQQGRVLFVSLEDEPELIRWRLAMLCEVYGLDAAAVSAGVTILDGTATAATLAIETGNGKQLQHTQAWQDLASAKGFDCLMVDNASDAFQANSNDAALVRSFMRGLQTLARQLNAACVLLAHIDKQGAKHGAAGNSYIGSTSWHNSARSRIALVEDTGTLQLLHEKHNLTTGAEPVFMSKGEHGVPVPMSQAGMQQDARAANALLAKHDAPDILEVLRKATTNGESISNTRKGNYTAWHVLHNFGLTGYKGREGKARFWRAVDWLYQDGQIANEEYRSEQRKTKTRIAVLAQAGGTGA